MQDRRSHLFFLDLSQNHFSSKKIDLIHWSCSQTALKSLMLEYGICESSLGKCLLAWFENQLALFYFLEPHQNPLDILHLQFPSCKVFLSQKKVPIFLEKLQNPDETLQLLVKGTAFQRRVWAQILKIPRGLTLSYREVGGALGKDGLARAVGSALAVNVIAIWIPCHRVIRHQGVSGEYRWGAWRKQLLLNQERRG